MVLEILASGWLKLTNGELGPQDLKLLLSQVVLETLASEWIKLSNGGLGPPGHKCPQASSREKNNVDF